MKRLKLLNHSVRTSHTSPCHFHGIYRHLKNTEYSTRLVVSYHVVVRRLVVLGGAEASQSLLEHEYAEWVTRRHQHVDTQVELVSVDDERLWKQRKTVSKACVCVSVQACFTEPHPGDVNLADHVFSLDVFSRLGDEDAFALATGIWLTDVRLVFFGPGVRLEVTVTARHSQTRS